MFLAFKSFDKRRNNNGLIGGSAGRVLILHDISHHDRPDQVFHCTGAAINILHRPHLLSGEECLTLNSYTTQQYNYDTHLALMSSPQMWVCCLVSSGVISLWLHAQDVTGALDSLERCPRTEVLRLTASPAPSCPHWESLYSLRYSSSVQAVQNSSTYVHIVRYDLLLCSGWDTWDITSDKLLLLREIKETFNKTGCTFSHSPHVISQLTLRSCKLCL